MSHCQRRRRVWYFRFRYSLKRRYSMESSTRRQHFTFCVRRNLCSDESSCTSFRSLSLEQKLLSWSVVLLKSSSVWMVDKSSKQRQAIIELGSQLESLSILKINSLRRFRMAASFTISLASDSSAVSSFDLSALQNSSMSFSYDADRN